MKSRKIGILMHISSLPAKYGIGTMGKEAYEFVDFLEKCHAKIWQILPLNVTSYGDSPYQSPSSLGLNYYFIDLDSLIAQNLLKEEEVSSIDWGDDPHRVNYEKIFNSRLKLLRIAYSRFNKNDKQFIGFLKTHKEFNDFALFMTIKELNSLKPWTEWDAKFKSYSPELEKKVIKENEETYTFYLWTQFEFIKQYSALKKYANSKGISIMGDLPIYVAFDSVEVWKYPELFELDEKHDPVRVAGCPPDCFSEDGQLWGNPLYNWDYHKKTNYRWWNNRIKTNLELFDLLRIDHFRGFSGYYAIPYHDTTARNGKWIKGPGFDLFKDKLDLNIVAEDLGFIDSDFEELMKKTNYPGMKIVTQALDNDDPKNIWRPSNYTYNFFSYTATHDSPTTKQFFDGLNNQQRELALKIIDDECKKLNVPFSRKFNNEQLTHVIVELNIASGARVAMTPMQDLLAKGKEGRMNFPSTLSTDNWSWRITKEEFNNSQKQISDLLSRYSDIYERRQ